MSVAAGHSHVFLRTESAAQADRVAAPSQSLVISDLSLFYGSACALNQINLSVARGEFVALLGPSGCGKTSLLRSIAGFVQPQRGTILLNGRDVAGLPPRVRNIGIVFQNYALFPHMTVLDNVRFGLECRNIPGPEATTRARAALDRVSLATFSERYPKQLSGGQQQRVALARAIVIEPVLMLLDEPLGALDKQLRLQMQSELKGLQRSLGVTAVFVTHDQEEAMAMADRIVVMRDGVIQQIDPPDQLFSRPCTAWVSDFVSAGNLIHGALAKGSGGALQVDIGHGSTFSVSPDPAVKPGEATLFVPFHKVAVQRIDGDAGLNVVGVRYLGLAVELQVAYADHLLRVQLPIGRAPEFPVGTRVRVAAEAADCRLLPTS